LWLDDFHNPLWVNEELMRTTRNGRKDEERHEDKIGNPYNGADDFTFVGLLNVCAKKKDLSRGRKLHHDIVNLGILEKNPYLATSLINMYAKCGALAKAREVLTELPVQDVASWNALISGYVQQGLGNEAISCFEDIQNDGFSPDIITYICILKACALAGDISMGKKVHHKIVNKGLLDKDIMLGTALIDMYARCGDLKKAQDALEGLPMRNVVSWSALISGYARFGDSYNALDCFDRMQSEGLSPDSVTFICVLKACGCAGDIEKGKEIHKEIVRMGLIKKEIALGTALVDMYAKCGLLGRARQVLEDLPFRNVISWSAMISGYVNQGLHNEALTCYEQMRSEGISPNSVTFIYILKAYGETGSLEKGKKIHEEILRLGFLEKDIILVTALAGMYAKCGALGKAQELLERLPVQDTVSWSALIRGYALQGQEDEVLECFERLQSENISVDEIILISTLKACGNVGAFDKGRQLHEEIARKGLLEKDIAIITALIDMYAKLGLLTWAQEVAQELPVQKVAPLNALMTGYIEGGHGHQALNCLQTIQKEGLSPNEITFLCTLKACGIIGALSKGQDVHHNLTRRGFLEKDIALGTALVDMYAKCGALVKAEQALDELPIRNLLSWSSLISGYSQQGRGQEALRCMERMHIEGLSPNEVTLLCVLSACARSGLLEEAKTLWRNMAKGYDISPTLEHHACMALAFGCSGDFKAAISMVKSKPPDAPAIWLALLGACRKWGNAELAKQAKL
jgi:pentatricopeptide repeat protein